MTYSGDDLFLTIQYKDQTFTEKIIDRDPTLIFLNRVIQPDYEIRFCKGSDGSDTLAFYHYQNQNGWNWKIFMAKKNWNVYLNLSIRIPKCSVKNGILNLNRSNSQKFT